MMPHEPISDAEIDGWLSTLGVATRCQWDVLAFLYHHRISLVGATLIAHLLGYGSEPVVAALDRLEILGLVERSPMSHRAHLYQFTVPADSTERDAWTHLLDLASQRAGRVRLTKHLSGGTRTAQAERDLTRHILDAAEQRVLASRRQLAIRQVLDAAEQRVLASRRQLPPPSGSEPPPS